MSDDQATTPGITIREATAADNDALIALELESPLLVGDVEETFDRSPDYFACQRVLPERRVVLGEAAGRVVGAMTGVVHEPVIRGQPQRLVYIRQARVHPGFHGRRVAWLMANDLFRWAGARGAKGPYYLILPENERSLAFVERGGGRWPVDVTLLEYDVSSAEGGPAERLPPERLADAAALVNATHASEEFFEPLSAESLSARLTRDARYGITDLRGVFEGGTLIAAGGLWDKGATTEQVHLDRTTGVTTRSRSAAVADWGCAPGRAGAFAELLRSLAGEARALGRSSLTVCEPSPGLPAGEAGALPDTGLPSRRVAVSLFTPSLEPPPAAAVRGLYADLLYV